MRLANPDESVPRPRSRTRTSAADFSPPDANVDTCQSASSQVADLPATERFFVWAIRTWAAHHVDPSEAWPILDCAFGAERLHTALAPFDRMDARRFCRARAVARHSLRALSLSRG